MTEKAEHFFLQRHHRSSWQTLYDAPTYNAVNLVLKKGRKQFASSKVRIIRGLWDHDTKKWDYQLIKLIDLRQTKHSAPIKTNSTEQTSKKVAHNALELQNLAQENKTDEKTRKAVAKKTPSYKILITTAFIFLVSTIGCILFIKNEFPIMFDQLNLLADSSNPKPKPHSRRPSIEKEITDLFTVGKVTKTYGVTEKLFGKWTVDKCLRDYVIFTPFDIQFFSKAQRTNPGLKYQVFETTEDDFNFFLKIQDGTILHYLKITENNISFTGITKAEGFVENSENQKVYKRCP
tara:strand:+ start:3010 stop:3882 length:873 start_codon:yes stop_codon:yes gene_type:complete